MTTLPIMLKKEWLENLRTHKALSLLITFAAFGILAPLTAVLMPEIMAKLLPQNVAQAIPDPTYLDSYNQYFKNINQLGLLILVLLFSGSLTQELMRGTLINLITKGLSKAVIIMAKFIMMTGLWSLAYGLGSLIHYGYTLYYFNGRGQDKLLVYAASWLVGVFLISLILFFSAFFRKTSGVLLGILAVIVVCFISSYFKLTKDYNPLLLLQHQSSYLTGSTNIHDLFIPSLILTALIFITLWLAIVRLRYIDI
ncbi:ABC transporter permease subunit [Streptococcus halichoeri]|uniref:ABC transporter permease subunit n=1 Tax=Streptococcus halichoeri TaxID=254785 RepID=UPI001359FA6F|nr:ABC transporter permease subunit [Streptococcus halichoeri]